MAIPSPFEIIPSQFHLASLFLTGIAGFLIVIGFSSAKPSPKSVSIKSEPAEDATVATANYSPQPSSPQPSVDSQGSEQTEMVGANGAVTTPKKPTRSTPRKKQPPTYGSVSTPGGRRSARIAQKSAKKPQE